MSAKSRIVEDPRVIISPSACVCKEAELIGPVTIGNRTVIHTKARIVAEKGPILIGENNLIEERTEIINKSEEQMVIGDSNFFEVGCYVESLKIGDHNVLEPKCKVGRNVTLTSGVVVGAKCEISASEVIPENTVIYGDRCERRIMPEKPISQSMHLDFLMKVLPNYHHLKKPTQAEPLKKA